MQKIEQYKKNIKTIQVKDSRFDFLVTGDLFKASSHDIMMNQVEGNIIDGSMNNLYLRFFNEKNEVASYYPLLGIKSNSKFSIGKHQARWKGEIREVKYEVRFILTDSLLWFWDVSLEGNNEIVDVVYGQDLGLANEGALKSNEAYVSQYVDHKVFHTEKNGYLVCSRQNQPQENRHPFIQQGALTEIEGYSTDAFQFFGTSYKETDEPYILSKSKLANENYQYECNFIGLQTKKMKLEETQKVTFYGKMIGSYPEAIENYESIEEISKIYSEIRIDQELDELPLMQKQNYFGKTLKSLDITVEELKHLYPDRIQEEVQQNSLLSFFTPEKSHVVLKDKERQIERPHGQILFTHNLSFPDEKIMSTTTWMYGIFNAQLVIGNTDMNKCLTNARNPLNYFKTSGQRVYVEIDEEYRLLALPSLMEIGINHVKWIYKTEKETFVVTNFTSSESSKVRLLVESKSGKKYRYLVTNQLAMNQREYLTPSWIEEKNEIISLKFDKNTESAKQFPDLTYYFRLSGAKKEIVEENFFIEGIEKGSTMLLNLKISETESFYIDMYGSLYGTEFKEMEMNLKKEQEKYIQFFNDLTNNFKLESGNTTDAPIEKTNIIVWWYTHNMMVHYLVPHGLEQYGGAAWGTRDVSQGPVEYLLSMQNYKNVRRIIERIYCHQHFKEGNWPQWFMFDHFSYVQADESHGDVIVWPLKLVADYLNITNDFSLLETKLSYFDTMSGSFTEKKETLFKHIEKQLEYIKSNFLENTFLSSYGDGDWDDTLQPHDQSLKKYMASSWTVALTYQALNTFSKALKRNDRDEEGIINNLSSRIKEDFERYILSDQIIPGFIYMPNTSSVKKMIHPKDEQTGIQYRLLPMIRSIISELFTEEQALSHYKIIKEYLDFPDGVRLMNRPAKYSGGVSIRFKRAEQAANFGREIGLMYVHAHIRYIEAMAKLGKEKEVWDGFVKVNPINIKQNVKNAELRQSNTYFSSSDANFLDRYQAQDNFDLVRKGEISVKGGWRIYSSGPGIYVNQLISNALGLRVKSENLVFDPVLKKEMDGLGFQFKYGKYLLKINYHYTDESVSYILFNDHKIKGKVLENPYRMAGIEIKKEDIKEVAYEASENIVDVFFTSF